MHPPRMEETGVHEYLSVIREQTKRIRFDIIPHVQTQHFLVHPLIVLFLPRSGR